MLNDIIYPEIIYFLGAGFSKSAGFPLINEFAKYFVKNYYYVKGKCPVEKFKKIRNLLTKDDNIENLLYNSESENIKNLIIKAIWLTISACSIDFCQNNTNIDYYLKFLKKIFKEKAALISLNYDTVLEICLEHYQFNNNIILPFNNFEYFIPDLQTSEYGPIVFINDDKINTKTIVFLKLHGAFNLFYCKNCGFAYLSDILDSTHSGICKKCKNTVEVAIVPPEISKKIDKFKNIWHKAEEIMKNAKIFIFIGINFNESDRDFIELVKKGFQKSNKNIFLVNFSKNQNEKEREKWKQKFFNLFNVKINSANIYLDGFEKWICKFG